jgi:hypothetical protein
MLTTRLSCLKDSAMYQAYCLTGPNQRLSGSTRMVGDLHGHINTSGFGLNHMS